MCVVSAVTDYYQRNWEIQSDRVSPFMQGRWISWVEWQEYLDLKRKAEEIDKKTNHPACQKPELEAWEQKVKKMIEEYYEKKGNK